MAEAETRLAESAQALFCYVADIIGKTKVNSDWSDYTQKVGMSNGLIVYKKGVTDFYKKYEKIINDSPKKGVLVDAKNNEIKKYLTGGKDIKSQKLGQSWFLSSILTAKKLINDLSDINSKFSKIENVGWQNIFYTRGDPEVMKLIGELFKIANKQAKDKNEESFGDINKWSPADIYFASEEAKKVISNMIVEFKPKKKQGSFSFAVLNNRLNKLINDRLTGGNLLPLSLKKVDIDKTIKIQRVNFSAKAEQNLIRTVEFNSVKDWSKMEGEYIAGPRSFRWTKPYTISGTPLDDTKQIKKSTKGSFRDIVMSISSSNGNNKFEGEIQIRHTPASKGKLQKGVKVTFKYNKSSAQGGQFVGMDKLIDYIKKVDPSFASSLNTTWTNSLKDFFDVGGKYMLYAGGNKLAAAPNKSKNKNIFNEDIGAISALTIMNDFRKKFTTYANKAENKKAMDEIVRMIFRYATSRSSTSGRFVIVKD